MRTTVAVAVVAEVSAGAGHAVEATGADSGADVVGYVVDVQLAKVIAVGRNDPTRSAHIHNPVTRLSPSGYGYNAGLAVASIARDAVVEMTPPRDHNAR